MPNYNLQELELIASAPSEYVRCIYTNIVDHNMGEHYCYLERSLILQKLSRSLDKTLKKQEEYMKSLNMVIPRYEGLN
jgi:hypothetical protein